MSSDYSFLIPLIRFRERHEGSCEEHEAEGGYFVNCFGHHFPLGVCGDSPDLKSCLKCILRVRQVNRIFDSLMCYTVVNRKIFQRCKYSNPPSKCQVHNSSIIVM